MSDWPSGVDEHAVFRALFAASPDGLVLVDDDGLIRLANPTALQLLGYPMDELVGAPIEMLVPDSIRPRHAAYRRAYEGAPRARPMGGTATELVARRRDGSEVLVEIALSPLQPLGLPYTMASIRSVAEYPRVRQALQRARYSEHLAQLGRVAVDSLDPQEVLRQAPSIAARALEADMAIVFLLTPDRTALRVAGGVGLLEEEGFGGVVPSLPDQPQGFVLAQGRPVVVEDYGTETRFVVPASYRRAGLVSALAVPLSDRGRPVGTLTVRSRQAKRFGDAELRFLESVANLLGTCLQRAQTEEALHHSQRLEAVGQLTGGIAHDFNNLLTVIQGNLQVLADLPAVSDDGFAPQLVAAATRASRRGAELTGKLLAFSRRQMLQPASVDVAAMMRSLADMLRRTLDQRIRIRIDVAPGCPDVQADPAQLESALLNIAINARDAMPEGGELVFEAAPLAAVPPELQRELDEEAADAGARYVRIAVTDSGTGMPDGVKERAFEPFFTTKQAGRGTGLGLSTVYGFARQSRGAVAIDSATGRGTTLTLILPQPPEAAHEAVDGDVAADAVPEGLRVLLVEDDPEVRAVARRFLTDLRCRVTACVSGEEALRHLQDSASRDAGRELPQLLLSDIALGAGMRGTELASRVQKEWPDTAVLLMSGFSAELLASGPEAALGWELLPKPYDRAALARAIAKVMSR
ncbi:GAF domain-containing protein [Mitsuaria sp. GD03876]|uniref:GAF domain-containing protein n=1 Tax=Mitsuaria sp. GD03876 TaxID=2975399 RepID=UPI002449911B|nr:GAF domain-containing protein [Mitsuaria sp. GD03876]MDH0866600.1 GAF domain-containing protein [Mitsuaria sp. GD03876]